MTPPGEQGQKEKRGGLRSRASNIRGGRVRRESLTCETEELQPRREKEERREIWNPREERVQGGR